jgi:hypothetical protein
MHLRHGHLLLIPFELKVARLSRLRAAKGNSIAQQLNYMTERGGVVTSETTGGQTEIHPAEGTQEEIQRRGPENVDLDRENLFAARFDSR